MTFIENAQIQQLKIVFFTVLFVVQTQQTRHNIINLFLLINTPVNLGPFFPAQQAAEWQKRMLWETVREDSSKVLKGTITINRGSSKMTIVTVE